MRLTTEILTPEELKIAVKLLELGEIVAFPTETVYGLGANALNPEAVASLFQAKGRPQDNPLIVHIKEGEDLTKFVKEIPQEAEVLMEKFWPGPLTLVLKKQEIIPPQVSAGLDTVGIRMPGHPLALKLLKKLDFPLAAPSANLSGKPSPTRAEHVFIDLGGKIPAILDGGETGFGLESTVLDCTVYPFRLLRPGGVTLEELRALVPVEYGEELKVTMEEIPVSPGMKYQHYAPNAEVYLVLGQDIEAEIKKRSEEYLEQGKHVGVLTWQEKASLYPRLTVLEMGKEGDLEYLARNLYHLLREADRLSIQVLFVEGVQETELGLTIMNRLRKASDQKIIET